MPRMYRVMTRDGDFPKVRQTGRELGVRERGEVLRETGVDDPRKYDIEAIEGLVSPGSGGTSVAPSLQDLPRFRVPERYGRAGLVLGARGRKPDDACWEMGDGPFESGPVEEKLVLRPDVPGHGTVQPLDEMPLTDYRSALAATQSLWTLVGD